MKKSLHILVLKCSRNNLMCTAMDVGLVKVEPYEFLVFFAHLFLFTIVLWFIIFTLKIVASTQKFSTLSFSNKIILGETCFFLKRWLKCALEESHGSHAKSALKLILTPLLLILLAFCTFTPTRSDKCFFYNNFLASILQQAAHFAFCFLNYFLNHTILVVFICFL